ncbi:MAG: hypothetical protein KGJ12_01200 [Gammaproteobacteria bacterium]|nr:hypothetical protein [Gammaproteobacteria bacterium]
MNYTALSLEQAPPLSVPLRFFLTAPLFGLAAALVLLWFGPAALTNRWSPVTLALTHLITLGFLTMTMFGAMLQLLPVLAGSTVSRPLAVSRLLHVSLSTGVVLLCGGFLSGRPLLLALAIPVLALACVSFVVVATMSLGRARGPGATVTAMRLAVAALAVAAALGLYLAARYGRSGFSVVLADVHPAWALLGWVGLLVIGVAYQVVPMFQMTPEYSASVIRRLAWALFALLASWSLAVLVPGRPDTMPAAVIGLSCVAGYALFAVLTLRLQTQRRRRLPDITLGYWRAGMLSLLFGAALWVAGWGVPALCHLPQYGLMLGVAMIVGFAVSVVSGMLYKIVPFLVWLHLQQRLHFSRQRLSAVPNMKQIIPERRARAQFRVQMLALPLLAAAVLEPRFFTYPAAVAFALSCLMLWFNLHGAVRTYRRVISKAGAILM